MRQSVAVAQSPAIIRAPSEPPPLSCLPLLLPRLSPVTVESRVLELVLGWELGLELSLTVSELRHASGT